TASLATAAAIVMVASAAAFFIGRRSGRIPLPRFHRLTFHSGEINVARFAPDGVSVVYDMLGDNHDLLVARTDNPGARAFGIGRSHLMSISPGGEVAILRDFTNTLLSD